MGHTLRWVSQRITFDASRSILAYRCLWLLPLCSKHAPLFPCLHPPPLRLKHTHNTQLADPSLLRFMVDMRGADPDDKQLRDDLMTMLIAGG